MNRAVVFLESVRDRKTPFVIFDGGEVAYFFEDLARLPAVTSEVRGWRLIAKFAVTSRNRDAVEEAVEAIVDESIAYGFALLPNGDLGIFTQTKDQRRGLPVVEGPTRHHVSLSN